MENKNIKRGNKFGICFFLTPPAILLAAFFVFFEAKAEENPAVQKEDVVINELMWMGMWGEADDEWIELYNATNEKIFLAGCTLQKKGGKSALKSKKQLPESIEGRSFAVISYNDAVGSSINVISFPVLGRYALSNDELEIRLVCKGETIDVAGDGSKPLAGEKEESGNKSMERNGDFKDGTLADSWHTCYEGKNLNPESVDCATPGTENSKGKVKIDNPALPVEPEKKKYAEDIFISELLADPDPSSPNKSEYVELYNNSTEDVPLAGWMLRDGSKTGKYVFPQNIVIKAKEYLAVFKGMFKFALNNSGVESVSLFDPNGELVSSVSYTGSKKGVSYDFDGLSWRWSRFLTPGAVNIFNNLPEEKDKIPKEAYVNVWAEFQVKARDRDGDKVKIVWDFGDGHKSYLAKTRHRYAKKGKYKASLKISDGSEDVIKNFAIKVEEYPRRKVRVVAVNANPQGKDSENETITLKNESKKKVNLKGWSVATGAKNLYNHPIMEDFEFGGGETKDLTREYSKFTLNNKENKIELRYPDGKRADRIKYQAREKSIAEGEVYMKTKEGWKWTGGISNSKSKITNGDKKEVVSSGIIESKHVAGEKEEIEVADSESVAIKKYPIKFVPENKIESAVGRAVDGRRVLCAETVREIDGRYLFVPEIMSEHYAIVFLKGITTDANEGINSLLNYFLD